MEGATVSLKLGKAVVDHCLGGRNAVGKTDGLRPEAEGRLLVQSIRLDQGHAGRAVHATDNRGVIARREILHNR